MEKFQPIGHAILNRSGIIQVITRKDFYTTLDFLIKMYFQAEPALTFDSVYVFAKGLAAMGSIKPANLSCEMEKPWDDGLSLYNYIDAVVSHPFKFLWDFLFFPLIPCFKNATPVKLQILTLREIRFETFCCSFNFYSGCLILFCFVKLQHFFILRWMLVFSLIVFGTGSTFY